MFLFINETIMQFAIKQKKKEKKKKKNGKMVFF